MKAPEGADLRRPLLCAAAGKVESARSPVGRRCAALLLTAAALAATSLTGCATPRAAGEPAWITGRLSVQIAATPARIAQSMSAAFELRGDGDSGELRLNSPLGTRLATARWAAGVAVLATAEGERRYAGLDELSRGALGEALPLAALPDWLAGKPWHGAPHQAGEAGFGQLGWQVDLARRAEGWVEASRSTAPAVRVRVRLDGAEP